MRRPVALTAALLALAPLVVSADVTLVWDAGAGDPPVGFIVERRVPPAGFVEVARTTAPPYTDTTLQPGVSTCWQVKAWNALGVSEPSNQVCLNLPTAPVSLTVSTSGPTGGQARVTVSTRVRKKR